MTVHCDELSAAIQRVAQFADERSNAIRMRVEKNELKVSSSNTETGESEDSIETAYAGDPMVIGFNSQYLLEFLKVVGSGDVRFEFKDAQTAGQLRQNEPRTANIVTVHCYADANLRSAKSNKNKNRLDKCPA